MLRLQVILKVAHPRGGHTASRVGLLSSIASGLPSLKLFTAGAHTHILLVFFGIIFYARDRPPSVQGPFSMICLKVVINCLMFHGLKANPAELN